MGDVLVEAIHPLAGQGEGHVLVGEAIAQLHPHRRQGQVVGAAERKQGKVAVAGALHAGFDRLDYRLRLHIPGRAREHARLAKAAAAGAAAADLHGEPVVHRLDMGHQAHGVVGHGGGGAAQHPPGDALQQRFEADAIGAGAIEGRHVHPRHLGQVDQQLAAAEASRLGFGHHQADLGQQLLAIAEGKEIEEGGKGFRVAGGRGPAGKDQGRRRRITEGQIAPLAGAQGHLGQVEHGQDVGGAQFVTEAETKNVEGGQGPAALNAKQGLTAGLQALGQVGRRQVAAIAELARNGIEN